MSSGFSERFKEKFENMIVEAMKESHIPGFSVAFVKDGQVLYARGFGARNLKDNLPATPDTLYGIGSCTKSFTALALMQLVEQGKIDVQDPVSKYLPFKLGSEENPIRIRHLLTMSSGIPSLGVAELLIGKATEDMEEKWIPMSSFQDLMLHVNGASEEIATEPGKRYFYLNTGFTLLGEIVERVSKMPYEQYIKEKILTPLKMNRSTFLECEFEKDTDTMTTYIARKKEDKLKVIPSRHPFNKFVYAPGGLLSSVMELTHYLIASIDGGVFEGTRILDESLMSELHKVQFESEMFRNIYGTNTVGKAGYGYGWGVIDDFLGHKLLAHGGSTGVSSAELMFVPDLKIGVAAAANVGGLPRQVLMGALAYLMGKDPEKEIPYFEIKRKLDMLTGEYEFYKGIHKISVVRKGGLLFLVSKEPGMEINEPLIPETVKIESYKFYLYGLGTKQPVEFDIGESGKIDLYIERNHFHKSRSLH